MPGSKRSANGGSDDDAEARRRLASEQTVADGEQTISDANQTAADLDQGVADVDARGSVDDQARSDADQRASDHDQSTADDEERAGTASASHGRDREASRAERSQTTDERARTTAARTRTAVQRLEIADQRDLAARSRDLASMGRDLAADARDRLAARHDNEHADAVRARAAEDRKRAAEDRVRAADDRMETRSDRDVIRHALNDAQLDDLTGTHRRAIGTLALQSEVDRAHRSHGRLVLAFVDVDDLRAHNQHGGHTAGDALLCSVVTSIRANLRSYDPVMRFGGDEFVCALCDADLTDAANRFHDIQVHLTEAIPGASFSVGFAALTGDDTLTDLITRGDQALYESKQNRIA